MKTSIIIPYMEITLEKKEILERCIASFTGADEIIVVENWRQGYAVPINYGLSQATGDFLIVMNDDLIWDGGSLKRLCDETAVTSPRVNGKSQSFWGCAFCLPRWVYEKTGGLDERYTISYFDDDDMWETLKKLDIPHYCIESVNLSTEGGTTLDKFPDRNAFFEVNKQKFYEKWGKLP
jgi:glycosyltransferase involved in cell wall biosynthesis